MVEAASDERKGAARFDLLPRAARVSNFVARLDDRNPQGLEREEVRRKPEAP